jgi:tetratricopeptide (TPR) repeat protein
MCIGIFVSSLTHSKIISYKEIKINKSPRISFVYILVLVFLLIASIYIGYVYASQYSSRVIFERATMEYSKEGDIQKTRSEIQKAQFIFGSDVYSRGLIELDLLEINQIIQNKELSQEQATIQFTQGLRNIIGQAQAMIAYDPNSYVNSSFLIMIYKNLTSLGVQDAKEETLRLIDSTSLLTPQNPTLALEKARVYVLGKEYDLAIEEIKKAIELKPNYVDAVFLLSQIQVEKGEIEQAIASIQAGIQVDQYNPNLRFQLGLLYYNQQKFNDAITYFENAIMLSPNFANAKYFLGLSYYKNNRTSDAITLFENLRTQIPDNQEIQLILNNLKTGQDPFMGAQPPLNTEPEDREELPLEDTLDESAENE